MLMAQLSMLLTLLRKWLHDAMAWSQRKYQAAQKKPGHLEDNVKDLSFRKSYVSKKKIFLQTIRQL